MARLFSRTWLCVCRSSSSLHDFKLAVRYFLQDSVDVIASFSWGLSGGLHATSMSSSTRFCALVTHLSCRPSRNAASTRAIVLRSWICSWLLCAARRWWRSRDRIVGAIQALASWSLFRSVFRTASPHQLSLLGLRLVLPLLHYPVPSAVLVLVFASLSSGCALCFLPEDHTYGCVQAPVVQYEILPWHGRVGALPATPLVLMGPVEEIALQL